MGLKFSCIPSGKGRAVKGLGSLFLSLAILAFPHLMAETLDSSTAQRWIRQFLKQVLSQQHMDDLKSSGLATPDLATAKRWEEDLENTDRLEFVSTQVNHFMFTPPFTTSRVFVVKAEIRDNGQKVITRYFSLSAENNLFDFFWVDEKTELMWFFSY